MIIGKYGIIYYVSKMLIKIYLKEEAYMDNFNDDEYAILIGNLLHDTRYIEISNMGKMAGLRKHAEVMVRKILNIGSSSRLMLGQIKKRSDNFVVRNRMESLGDELSDRLISVIGRINPLGRAGTHTQHTDDFSDEEIMGVEDAILDLYALIFIKYFLDIQVSIYSEPRILHVFSLLPPVIRYKTWSFLYERDKNNIQVVDKLCLSIIKYHDKPTAYKWLEDNREEIEKIPYPTKSEVEKYDRIHVIETSPGHYEAYVPLDFERYSNIYDLLYSKISANETSINESGKMYKSFEEAKGFYNKYKSIEKNASEELERLYHLMDFVYLGRKIKSDR